MSGASPSARPERCHGYAAAVAPAALIHRGVRFAGPGQLATLLAPELRSALRRGDAVAAALDAPSAAALSAELGDDVAGVHFVDVTRPARVSALQLAASRAAKVAATAAAGRRSLFVGQNQPGLGLGDAYWCHLEAAVAVALAHLPVTLLCPYAADAPPGEGGALGALHAEIVEPDGTGHHNPAHRTPAQIAAEMPFPPLPDLGRPDAVLPVDRGALADLRRRFAEAVGAGGAAVDDDLVYAVSEVATNSVEHGAGEGRVSVWTPPGEPVVCEVFDAGHLGDPFPGVRPPTAGQLRGRGVWLARTLCAEVEVRVDPTGTRVRLRGAPRS